MAGLQQQSMVAPVRDVNDVPDRPYFVNKPVQEDDEEEEEPITHPAKRKEPVVKTAEKQIVPRVPITPTYRPAFVPPKPQVSAAKPAEKPKVDLSHVGAGTVVIHKAFGKGIVSRIGNGAGGSTYVRVILVRQKNPLVFLVQFMMDS